MEGCVATMDGIIIKINVPRKLEIGIIHTSIVTISPLNNFSHITSIGSM